jgi:hypothetical protein
LSVGIQGINANIIMNERKESRRNHMDNTTGDNRGTIPIRKNEPSNICRFDSSIRNHVRVYGSFQKVSELYKNNILMLAMKYKDNFYICYKQNGIIYATKISLSNKKQ